MERWKNFSVAAMSLILFFCFALAGVHSAEAVALEPPEIEWEYTYGGNGYDEINSLRQTSDGGYILAGGSGSTGGRDVSDHHGDLSWLYDYWIVKLDEGGYKEWAKSYGGVSYDSAVDVLESRSGGYIVTGYTQSSNDVVGAAKGRNDAWVLKLDDEGESVWSGARSFGGSGIDTLVSIAQTPESHAFVEEGEAHDTYVLLGMSASNTISGGSTGSVGDNKGSTDIWLYKLYEHGDHHHCVWTKTYGTAAVETASKILNDPAGGYIVIGSIDDRDSENMKSWIFKVDEDGELVWEKKLGGDGEGEKHNVRSFLLTSDGGFIVVGEKHMGHDHDHSDEGEHDHEETPNDYWVAKLNAGGDVEWERTYGSAASDDIAWDIEATPDGGYIVVGMSESNYLEASNHGDYDALIVKISATGDPEWSMSLGGSGYDEAISIQRASDGGYVIGGTLGSTDGRVGSDNGDYWVIKLAEEIYEPPTEDPDDSYEPPFEDPEDLDPGNSSVAIQKGADSFRLIIKNSALRDGELIRLWFLWNDSALNDVAVLAQALGDNAVYVDVEVTKQSDGTFITDPIRYSDIGDADGTAIDFSREYTIEYRGLESGATGHSAPGVSFADEGGGSGGGCDSSSGALALASVMALAVIWRKGRSPVSI
ncbi:MAG: hypothetical protein LBS75_07645 [Synergistaceae bacterium]|nr:hypothetical protein [Synergistaceae bacterium]